LRPHSQKSCREKNVYLSFFSRHGFWRGDLVFTRQRSRETIFPEQTCFFCCRMKSILFYLADVARGKFFLEQALSIFAPQILYTQRRRCESITFAKRVKRRSWPHGRVLDRDTTASGLGARARPTQKSWRTPINIILLHNVTPWRAGSVRPWALCRGGHGGHVSNNVSGDIHVLGAPFVNLRASHFARTLRLSYHKSLWSYRFNPL
jgi:hypothetical protein